MSVVRKVMLLQPQHRPTNDDDDERGWKKKEKQPLTLFLSGACGTQLLKEEQKLNTMDGVCPVSWICDILPTPERYKVCIFVSLFTEEKMDWEAAAKIFATEQRKG